MSSIKARVERLEKKHPTGDCTCQQPARVEPIEDAPELEAVTCGCRLHRTESVKVYTAGMWAAL